MCRFSPPAPVLVRMGRLRSSSTEERPDVDFIRDEKAVMKVRESIACLYTCGEKRNGQFSSVVHRFLSMLCEDCQDWIDIQCLAR